MKNDSVASPPNAFQPTSSALTSTSELGGQMQHGSVNLEELESIYVLESVKGFGPQKFRMLHSLGIPIDDVLRNPDVLPEMGKRGAEFKRAVMAISAATIQKCKQRALHQLQLAQQHDSCILTYNHPAYPAVVLASNNPVPVLYVRGPLSIVTSPNTVACVGSRGVRSPYTEAHRQFASAAVRSDFCVVSGFATGADAIGHRTAFAESGFTIAVMPGGLEKPFPPEHKSLWVELLSSFRAVFVTEFGFGTRAASLTLKKRNKLIVAFALGVFLSQSSDKGGAMNAYRFAREQRKPVATVAGDSGEDTSGNHLIEREAKPGDVVFGLEASDQDYEQWLRGLSSSI